MKERVCPRCGAELRWVRRGDREAGCCKCNPQGPVVERDVPDPGVALERIPGLNEEIVAALHARGYMTLAQVQAASDAELLAVSGIGPARLARIRNFEG